MKVRVSRETLSTLHLAGRDPHRSRKPHQCGRQRRPDWPRPSHLQSERRLPVKLRTECATATAPDCRILRREGVRRVSRETSSTPCTENPTFASSLRWRDDTSLGATAAAGRRVPAAPHFKARDSSGRAGPVCEPQSISRHREGTTDRSSPRARHQERRALRLSRFDSSSRP